MISKIAETLKALPIRDRADEGGELDQLRLREAARAVLVAIREPSKKMVDAAYWAAHDESAEAVWQKMIDTALSEDAL